MNLSFFTLPEDIQEKILDLAAQFPLTIDEVRELYLMGEDHTNILCYLKSAGYPDSFIQLQNNALWEKKNKEWANELKKV